MPTRQSKAVKGAYIELEPDILAQMKALAELNYRTFREEVECAFRRHLKKPPVVEIKVEMPELEEENLTVPADRAAKKDKGKTTKAAKAKAPATQKKATTRRKKGGQQEGQQ